MMGEHWGPSSWSIFLRHPEMKISCSSLSSQLCIPHYGAHEAMISHPHYASLGCNYSSHKVERLEETGLLQSAAVFPLGKTMSQLEARIREGLGREHSEVTDFQLAKGPLVRSLSRKYPSACLEQPGYWAASYSRKLSRLLPLWNGVNCLVPPSPSWKELLHQWKEEGRKRLEEG